MLWLIICVIIEAFLALIMSMCPVKEKTCFVLPDTTTSLFTPQPIRLHLQKVMLLPENMIQTSLLFWPGALA